MDNSEKDDDLESFKQVDTEDEFEYDDTDEDVESSKKQKIYNPVISYKKISHKASPIVDTFISQEIQFIETLFKSTLIFNGFCVIQNKNETYEQYISLNLSPFFNIRKETDKQLLLDLGDNCTYDSDKYDTMLDEISKKIANYPQYNIRFCFSKYRLFEALESKLPYENIFNIDDIELDISPALKESILIGYTFNIIDNFFYTNHKEKDYFAFAIIKDIKKEKGGFSALNENLYHLIKLPQLFFLSTLKTPEERTKVEKQWNESHPSWNILTCFSKKELFHMLKYAY